MPTAPEPGTVEQELAAMRKICGIYYLAARRAARTYQRDGHEVYADTGRPVDEALGTHVLLWIVDDPEAWARAVETEGDAELTLWPKRQRYLAEARRAQRYESAAQIRADGPGRSWYSHFHDAGRAEASAADLRRSHPNPGVRYEVAPITAVGACPSCHQPTVQADGQWRHHTGRYPAECAPEPEPEPERLDGEFEVSPGMGTMTCGYCERTETWAHAVLGYAQLTGVHLLGVERATNTLVVLAEATTLAGGTTYLPHHCLNIPEDKHREYAPNTVLARELEPASELDLAPAGREG